MGVSVIGAGSVGMLFAAYLMQAGNDVTLYTRTRRQADKLNKDGLTLVVEEHRYHYNVKASPLTPYTVFADHYIVVAVKQYHLQSIYSILKNNQNNVYLFVQNGMGHLSILKRLVHSDVLLAVVEHGALKQSDTNVRHTGYGIVKVASFQGEIGKDVRSFIASWQQERFPISFLSDWYTMLANKLVANAVINPLTALFAVKNGKLLVNSFFFSVMEQLFRETVSVLNINEKTAWEHVQSICLKTANNESSMLRDLKTKRKSEIEAISGYILQLGMEQGKHLPYTTFVYNAIKGLEEANQEVGDPFG